MVNRLAIFIFYDKQGIVDDYIPYFLDKLKPFLRDLIIIVNGNLVAIGQKKLKSLTKNLFIRENIGYEPGAIKEILFKLHGFEKILQYDELLICNDTFYGPFFDIKEVFSKMDKTECDFWGITEQAAKKGFYPKHIQSYFYNIKKNLLHNKHFRDFFENLPLPKNLNQAIKSYKIAMSKFFLNKGFSYASFIDENNFIEDNAKENFDYSLVSPMNLLKNRCPFIKKKAFFVQNEETSIQGGEQSNGLIQFIENNTKYPQKIIWQNLLRTTNITEMKNKLHLQYILPKNTLISNSKKLENKKIAVVVHLYYIDLLNECLAYLDNIPKFIDLIVTTTKIEIAEKVQKYFGKRRKYEIRLIENRGRDVAALLVHCKDIFQKYDYLCFTHDKNKSGKLTKIEANSFRFLLWECTLASECYIKNILNKFESEPELGFLNVPQPFHGMYLGIFKDEWCENFLNAKTFMKNLGLNCNLHFDIPAFAIGTAFWCKTNSLTPLLNLKISDFPKEPIKLNKEISHAIERIFPYVAQCKGYYSGICLTDSYAQTRINCLENIIRKKERDEEREKEKYLEKAERIFLFAKKYSVIYIYGAGIWGERITKILKHYKIEYKGFIVSKKQKKIYLRKPILELTEVVFNKNTGIILGLDKDNSLEVLKTLRKRKVDKNCILRINF